MGSVVTILLRSTTSTTTVPPTTSLLSRRRRRTNTFLTRRPPRRTAPRCVTTRSMMTTTICSTNIIITIRCSRLRLSIISIIPEPISVRSRRSRLAAVEGLGYCRLSSHSCSCSSRTHRPSSVVTISTARLLPHRRTLPNTKRSSSSNHHLYQQQQQQRKRPISIWTSLRFVEWKRRRNRRNGLTFDAMTVGREVLGSEKGKRMCFPLGLSASEDIFFLKMVYS